MDRIPVYSIEDIVDTLRRTDDEQSYYAFSELTGLSIDRLAQLVLEAEEKEKKKKVKVRIFCECTARGIYDIYVDPKDKEYMEKTNDHPVLKELFGQTMEAAARDGGYKTYHTICRIYDEEKEA